MNVSDLMTDAVVTVSPDEPVSVAARLLYRHNIGAIPVCTTDGRLRGILTDRDITLRCVATDNDPDRTTVGEIMSRSLVTVSPGDTVEEAAERMAQAQVRRLPVVEDGRLVGMLALGDMARTHQFAMEASKALSEISSNIRKR
jgi:CBS domain-containing protein